MSVSAQSLIVPGLYPGKVVVLASTTVEGPWMVSTVRFSGSTVEAAWYADMELKEYDVA